MMSAKYRQVGRVALAAAGPVLMVALVACGGSSKSPVITNAPAPAPSASGGTPGAVGVIAAQSGNSIQVQGASSQVTVDLTGSTRVTQEQQAAFSAIAVGDCVTVTGTPSGSSVTARSVVISKPVNGACQRGGFGGGGLGGGGGFGGGGRGRPSGSPRPSGAAQAGATVNGTVQSVSGTSLTVNGVERMAGASAAPAQAQVSVATNASTRYTDTVVVGTSALKVGECVIAAGSSNDIGTIQASTIAILSMDGQGGGCGGRGAGSARPGASNG